MCCCGCGACEVCIGTALELRLVFLMASPPPAKGEIMLRIDRQLVSRWRIPEHAIARFHEMRSLGMAWPGMWYRLRCSRDCRPSSPGRPGTPDWTSCAETRACGYMARRMGTRADGSALAVAKICVSGLKSHRKTSPGSNWRLRSGRQRLNFDLEFGAGEA